MSRRGGPPHLGCTYKLASAPPEPDSLYVFFDKDQQVLRDAKHAKGWDYDGASQTVTFYGSTCASLKSGDVKSLDIVFGCPTTDTVPVPPACASGVGCDTTHLCPADDKMQPRYCTSGCCTTVPPIQ